MVAVIVFLFQISLASVFAIFTELIEELPLRYMSNCPSSTDKATISPDKLEKLFFVVWGPGNFYTAKRTKYTYYQMKELSKDIDFTRKTVVYSGGYFDSAEYPSNSVLAEAYLAVGYNALCLDTYAFTSTKYSSAARFIRPVGFHVGEMLSNLSAYGMDPKKLELVGLSLGGQTISFIAKNYRMLTGRNVSRVTSLDPAGPCFRNLGPDQRIDKSDADFVDIVYTNVDAYGMTAPVGHLNFYVNGGEYQPALYKWIPCGALCSHVRSFFLWKSAVYNPNSFIAIKCKSVQQARNQTCYDNKRRITNLFGLKTDRTKHGIYFLATQGDYPYYMGKKGLHKNH